MRVAESADVVAVRIPWRRWDAAYDEKGVVVVDETTGETVRNAVWYHVSRDEGDVVFQPATAPGDYGVYIDQIGYGRETMLRVARVLSAENPGYHMVYHAGEMFLDEQNPNIYWTRASAVLWSLDHIPFMTQLPFDDAGGRRGRSSR